MKINFKRLSTVFLTTIMLSSYSLNTTNCYAESKIKDFLLTENQVKDNYSYMIGNDYEDSFKEEHIKVYNEAIYSLINRNESFYLPFDDATNLKICDSIYHSPYNMLFKRVFYDIENRTINVEYLYDLDEQNKVLMFLNLINERINTQNKIIK